MNPVRRTPGGTGILMAFLILILTLVGCEKGPLGVTGGSVSGYVVDSRTLAGVYGVNVTAVTGDVTNLASKNTVSDSKGSYYFSDLRPGEWKVSFDKVGYTPVSALGSGAVSVVVVNNDHSNVPEVRMVQTYANIYITVKGTLKDAITGSEITLGYAQFTFGNKSYNNEYPSHFRTGFQAPATDGPMVVTIALSGYQPFTTTIDSAINDVDLGVILLQPQTYKIVGVWKDVPGWVQQAAGNQAKVVAYAQNRVLGTATANMNEASFEINGIPMGTSVTVEVEVRGYRMNSPILVTPNGDFQGVLYQSFSLQNNFSPILRDVRMFVFGNNIGNTNRVGGYCNETGAEWPVRTVTSVLGSPNRVVDLGIVQVPTGYIFNFTGYNVDNGTMGNASAFISDDGAAAQTVKIQL